MTARTLSAVVLVLTALAAATLPTLPAQAAEGNVAVHVEDEGGDPIEGATVFARSDVGDVGSQSASTDADGDATLLLAPGEWTIEAKAAGYEAAKKAVTVTATGAEASFTLEAAESDELEVLVHDPSGQPVEGADVVVRDPEGDEVASEVTDDNGEAAFDLAHGLYYVTAGKSGWSKGEGKIDFTAQDDRLKIQLPLFGDIVRKNAVSRFARTLGTLLKSGVPILSGLSISKEAMANVVLMDDIDEASAGVKQGRGLAEIMRKSRYLPPMVVDMIAVGEEGGNLDEVLVSVADSYDLQVERAIRVFIALFEPALLVVMASIVGFIVIAMLLPVFTLSSMIK